MASGDSLIFVDAECGRPPSSNAATFAYRNGIGVWEFADAADSYVEFSCFMPRHYGSGGTPTGVTVLIGWAAEVQAGTETCRWSVAFKSFTDDVDDIDTKSFATANTGGAVCASGSGEIDYYSGITPTHGSAMDSVAAGEFFRLQIGRDGDGTTGTDDLTDVAQLVFVEIQET